MGPPLQASPAIMPAMTSTLTVPLAWPRSFAGSGLRFCRLRSVLVRGGDGQWVRRGEVDAALQEVVLGEGRGALGGRTPGGRQGQRGVKLLAVERDPPSSRMPSWRRSMCCSGGEDRRRLANFQEFPEEAGCVQITFGPCNSGPGLLSGLYLVHAYQGETSEVDVHGASGERGERGGRRRSLPVSSTQKLGTSSKSEPGARGRADSPALGRGPSRTRTWRDIRSAGLAARCKARDNAVGAAEVEAGGAPRSSRSWTSTCIGRGPMESSSAAPSVSVDSGGFRATSSVFPGVS